MADPTIALTRQMLEWISSDRRTYADVLDVWRTSCPRLSIWEDACINGLIESEPGSNIVSVSAKGRALLADHDQSRA
ncbi:MAG: hypothetical protein ACJ8KA_04125 [Sulfurifustis sp.]